MHRQIVVARQALAPALLIALMFVASIPVLAQTQSPAVDRQASVGGHDPASGPPHIMAIYREDVKAGKTASHEKLEARFARAYARTSWARPYLALSSLSGAPQAWFVVPYDSLSDLEKEYKLADQAPAATKTVFEQLSASEADHLDSSRLVLAFYREELSFKPAADIPRMRYMAVTTFRVRPGRDMQFAEAAKLVRAAYEKAGVDEKWALYQVRTGAPDGTYFVMQPMKALAEFEPDKNKEEAYRNALGKEGGEKLMQLASEAIINSETQIFAFNPKMSYVPEHFATIDPDFWGPANTERAVATTGKTSDPKQVKKK
jgi:hypothetical protein